MAIDEAILRAVARGEGLPALRLYAWEPPCVSLGRGQSVEDVDRHAVDADGCGLVRRPTGGRAILHIDELTYSVIAPEDDPRVSGTIIESYRRLSRALVRALEILGFEDVVASQKAENRGVQGSVCFEVPSDYEITAEGKKLVGSAQMRAQGMVLQHGSIPLRGDIARICPLLASHPDPAHVRTRATTVERVLGRDVSWAEAAEAVTQGFAEKLHLCLEPEGLTEAERALADKLRLRKYAAETWTRRV